MTYCTLGTTPELLRLPMMQSIQDWLCANSDRHFSLTFSHVRSSFVGTLYYKDVRGAQHNVAHAVSDNPDYVIEALVRAVTE